MTAELESVVGSGNVRLLGPRGATARADTAVQAPSSPQSASSTLAEAEMDDGSLHEMDDD
jgi:hypothetical protein